MITTAPKTRDQLAYEIYNYSHMAIIASGALEDATATYYATLTVSAIKASMADPLAPPDPYEMPDPYEA